MGKFMAFCAVQVLKMTLSRTEFNHLRQIERRLFEGLVYLFQKEQGLGLIRAKRLSPPTFLF
jgi:hypothetical protein